MNNQEIEDLLTTTLNLSHVQVAGDGSHFSIIAVSDDFADMSRVKRQQTVYAPLSEKVADGSMHAISIKTFTEADWQREKAFHQPTA